MFRIKSSPDKRKSTLVVDMVMSAVPNGQFDPFKSVCVPSAISTQSWQLCKGRWYKHAAWINRPSCNITQSVFSWILHFSVFLWQQEFFCGDHCTTEGCQKGFSLGVI